MSSTVVDLEQWTIGLFLMIRVLAAVWVTPFLSGVGLIKGIPALVRVAIAAALCLAILPAAGHVETAPLLLLDGPGMALAVFSELVVGAGLGLIASVALYGADMGGALLSSALRGHGQTVPSDRGLARFSMWVVVTLFFALGGHHLVLAGLHESVVRFAPGQAIAAPPTATLELVQATGLLFLVCLAIALPVVVGLVLVDVGTALAGRHLRRLHDRAIMVPVRTLAFLILLTAAAAGWIELVRSAGHDSLNMFDHLLRTLGG